MNTITMDTKQITRYSFQQYSIFSFCFATNLKAKKRDMFYMFPVFLQIKYSLLKPSSSFFFISTIVCCSLFTSISGVCSQHMSYLVTELHLATWLSLLMCSFLGRPEFLLFDAVSHSRFGVNFCIYDWISFVSTVENPPGCYWSLNVEYNSYI